MSKEVYTWGDYCLDHKKKGANECILPSIVLSRSKDFTGWDGVYSYMTEYAGSTSTIQTLFSKDIDIFMYEKYKNVLLPLDSKYIYSQSQPYYQMSYIDYLVSSFFRMNDYKLQTLYDSMFFEYNPIWNVDGTETTTTIHGATSSADSYGAKTDTDVNGKRESSNDSKSYRYPYDSGTKTATDELEESATTESSTDTHTSSEHSDTHTTESYTDTVTNERAGNIGVTSTQSLIEQERSVAMFSFYEILYDELIKAISIPVFDDSESEVCLYDSLYLY